MSFNIWVRMRRPSLGQLAAAALTGAAVVLAMVNISPSFRDELIAFGTRRETVLAVLGGTLVALLATILILLKLGRTYTDQIERARMSELQTFERNIRRDLDTITAREASKLVPKEVIQSIIDARIDEAFVSGVDKAVRKRLDMEAKVIDVIDYIESAEQRIRTMLDGPAERAERRSGWLMFFAIIIGACGIFIAYLRVKGLGNLSDSLLALKSIVGEGSVWPYIFALSAPWVTLIALVEFTALMLLKISNKLSIEQRHYTELLVEFTDRILALKAIVRFGNADQVVTAASLLLRNNPKVEAKSEGLEESLSAVTKITESLAAIVKQFASKESKPTAS